jgi:hypothetical protein
MTAAFLLTTARCASVFLAALSTVASAQSQTWHVEHYLEPFKGPLTYVEPASGAIFYVESDGLHLAKIEKSGTLAWVKDPRVGSPLPEYRTSTPKLYFVGDPHQCFRAAASLCISIRYTNSQFGEVDAETGAFYPGGQD